MAASALLATACGGGGDGVGGRDGAVPPSGDGATPPPSHDGSSGDAAIPGADGATPPPPIAACRVERSFELAGGDTDTYPLDVAVRGREIGLLVLVESPRRIVFARSTLDEPGSGSAITLGETPILSQAGVVPFGEGFAAAWSDFPEAPLPRVRVSRIVDGALLSDTRLGGTVLTGGAMAGLTPSGRLAVAWGEQLPPAERYELRVATSDDGESFAPSTVVSEGVARSDLLSATASAEGMGLAWVERIDAPNHTTLRFALVADDGSTSTPTRVVEHDRYIYETALAFGSERFALATTDSRDDILTVPLYLTMLEADGAVLREGIRLTRDDHQESVDIAFGGNAFGLVVVPFMNMASSNEQQVLFRQMDADGEQIGAALQVSSASIRESDCCIRANHAHIATIEAASYLVVWSEHAQRPDRPVFVVRGAVVDCKP